MVKMLSSITASLDAETQQPKPVIESGQTLKLSQADAELVMTAFDHPPKANAKLKLALKRFEHKAQ